MKNKALWIDTETGGLDHRTDALLEIALIVGDATFQSYIKPPDHLNIRNDALKINKITREQIATFPSEPEVFNKFAEFIYANVDVLDKEDTLIPHGYNSRFDCDFLHSFWKRNTKHYYGAVISFYDVDVFALVKMLWSTGEILRQPNLKLGSICKQMGIKFDDGVAHNALYDIRKTKKLWKKLNKGYLK